MDDVSYAQDQKNICQTSLSPSAVSGTDSSRKQRVKDPQLVVHYPEFN
jgi:hypothetical protein